MIPILLAALQVMLNMVVQTTAVLLLFRFTVRARSRGGLGKSYLRDSIFLGRAMVLLFFGHVIQIALWAVPFRLAGQFDSFTTAFYHSTVNYSSLGYGDIVMTGRWELTGALEAACGTLMFGVSTASFFALMSGLFRHRFAGLRDDHQ